MTRATFYGDEGPGQHGTIIREYHSPKIGASYGRESMIELRYEILGDDGKTYYKRAKHVRACEAHPNIRFVEGF